MNRVNKEGNSKYQGRWMCNLKRDVRGCVTETTLNKDLKEVRGETCGYVGKNVHLLAELLIKEMLPFIYYLVTLGFREFREERKDKCLTLSLLISLQNTEFIFCQPLRLSNLFFLNIIIIFLNIILNSWF